MENLNDDGRISYWETLIKSKQQNQIYPKASKILQNIQNHHNLVQIVMEEYDIESKSVSFEDLGDL